LKTKSEQSKYFCLFSLTPQRNYGTMSPHTQLSDQNWSNSHFSPTSVHIT